ncbi:MAG: metalloregulator ArsR/SmtB family transcription factor [Coriobacteriales bacterium]|jgi:ArsR family transcriptional regulator|nr:metalloregulator ArsR/SmtB family transcription factor [Coriobacteriales bacterium]
MINRRFSDGDSVALADVLVGDCCEDVSSPERLGDIIGAEAVLPGDDVIYKVTEIFSALADSTRLKILSSLIGGELCVCEMQEVCDVSQSAVSHQLRLLRDRGLVRSRRDGQRSVYRLADDHVSQLIRIGIEHAVEEGR